MQTADHAVRYIFPNYVARELERPCFGDLHKRDTVGAAHLADVNAKREQGRTIFQVHKCDCHLLALIVLAWDINTAEFEGPTVLPTLEEDCVPQVGIDRGVQVIYRRGLATHLAPLAGMRLGRAEGDYCVEMA